MESLALIHLYNSIPACIPDKWSNTQVFRLQFPVISGSVLTFMMIKYDAQFLSDVFSFTKAEGFIPPPLSAVGNLYLQVSLLRHYSFSEDELSDTDRYNFSETVRDAISRKWF